MKNPIHDITDPGKFLPESPALWQTWWFWFLVALGIILILTLLFFTFKKQSSSQQEKTLLDKALQRLETLKTEAPDLSVSTTATRVSLIVRRYLEAAFDDTSLFETNEEFTLCPHALERLHPNFRKLVTDHLASLAHLKYAPILEIDTLAYINQAEEILVHIESHP